MRTITNAGTTYEIKFFKFTHDISPEGVVEAMNLAGFRSASPEETMLGLTERHGKCGSFISIVGTVSIDGSLQYEARCVSPLLNGNLRIYWKSKPIKQSVWEPGWPFPGVREI
jgi:hypothetical protein